MKKILLGLVICFVFVPYSFVQAQQFPENIFYEGFLAVQSAQLTSDGNIAILSKGNKLLLIDKDANVLWDKAINYEKHMGFYSMSLIEGNKFLLAGSIGWVPIMAFIDQDGELIETVTLEEGEGRRLLAAIRLENSDYFVMEMLDGDSWNYKVLPVELKRLNESFEELWSYEFVDSYYPPNYSYRYRIGQKPDQSLVAFCNYGIMDIPVLAIYSPDGELLFSNWGSNYTIGTDMALDNYGNVFTTGYSPYVYGKAVLSGYSADNSGLVFQRYFDDGETAAYGICVVDSNLVAETGWHNDDLFFRLINYDADSLKLFFYNSFPQQTGVAVLSDGTDIFVIGGEGRGIHLTNNFLITIPIDSLFASITKRKRENKLSVWPNPFRDNIYFDANSFHQTSDPVVEIFTLQGKKVYEGVLINNSGTTALNLSFLDSGVYILSVTFTDKRRLFNRIIKL